VNNLKNLVTRTKLGIFVERFSGIRSSSMAVDLGCSIGQKNPLEIRKGMT
jgi:hypothetical protein